TGIDRVKKLVDVQVAGKTEATRATVRLKRQECRSKVSTTDTRSPELPIRADCPGRVELLVGRHLLIGDAAVLQREVSLTPDHVVQTLNVRSIARAIEDF